MIKSVPKSLGKLGLAGLLILISPAFAEDQREPISEADLRTLLPFGNDATLKYAVCEKKSYPTCTYVWGIPDSSDATRVKLGGKPEGDKLMTVFAQARNMQEFDRVIAVYPDAEQVENLGVAAVWSAKRDQLSLITADNLIIHVNVEGPADPRAIATQVAAFVLACVCCLCFCI